MCIMINHGQFACLIYCRQCLPHKVYISTTLISSTALNSPFGIDEVLSYRVDDIGVCPYSFILLRETPLSFPTIIVNDGGSHIFGYKPPAVQTHHKSGSLDDTRTSMKRFSYTTTFLWQKCSTLDKAIPAVLLASSKRFLMKLQVVQQYHSTVQVWAG